MNKQEQKARKICAMCNWVAECEDCPHRDWSKGGKWYDEPRFDYKECTEWKYYLENPILNRWRRFLCWIGLHKWYMFGEFKPPYVHRKCTRCGVEQEYIKRNNDWRYTCWIYSNGRLV